MSSGGNKIIFAKIDPGFYSNPKIIRAGRNGREVFHFALLVNAARGATGVIPAHDLEPWYLAIQLRIPEPEAAQGVALAIAAELLERDEHSYSIIGWDSDWSRRPLSRAEIQKNYRERNKEGDNRYQDSVTRYQRSNALPIDQRDQREEIRGNAVTPASPADSLSRDLDSESTSAPKGRAARHAARGTSPQPTQRALSAAWQPTEAAVNLAHSLGLDPAHEATQFRLNARAKGHTFSDPDAAFEKFVRGSHDAGKPTKPKPKPGATTTAPKRMRQRTEDGQLLEENDAGELVPVSAAGSESAGAP